MNGVDEAAALLAELGRRGAVVALEGGAVRVRARPGALDDGLRAAIRARKAGLIALLAGINAATAAAPAGARSEAVSPAPADRQAGQATDASHAEATTANVLAAPPQEQAAWRREVVHALVWAEAGRWDDPHLAHDLAALRRIVPAGTCLHCDGPCEADGRPWCGGCAARHAEGMRRTG